MIENLAQRENEQRSREPQGQPQICNEALTTTTMRIQKSERRADLRALCLYREIKSWISHLWQEIWVEKNQLYPLELGWKHGKSTESWKDKIYLSALVHFS